MKSLKFDQDYKLVMDLSDEDLTKYRAWMKWLILPLDPEAKNTRVADRARAWRDKRRGGPPRPTTNYLTATHFACCGREIIPEHTRVSKTGQKACRHCANDRIRLWRARRARHKGI